MPRPLQLHRELPGRRPRRERDQLRELELHGVRDGHRPGGMRVHPSEPRGGLLPGRRRFPPLQRLRAREAAVPHNPSGDADPCGHRRIVRDDLEHGGEHAAAGSRPAHGGDDRRRARSSGRDRSSSVLHRRRDAGRDGLDGEGGTTRGRPRARRAGSRHPEQRRFVRPGHLRQGPDHQEGLQRGPVGRIRRPRRRMRDGLLEEERKKEEEG
mmetsp:Transcript_7510/g.18479  ORF Transcript_7510/g.18479 Transcript_7510/m.18479 type:complete len:211 (-) Transcript_7510:102-734(-)